MPQTALFMLGVLFLILPLLYLMCLVVTRIRTLVHKKLCGKKATVSPMEIDENPSEECGSNKDNKSETA